MIFFNGFLTLAVAFLSLRLIVDLPLTKLRHSFPFAVQFIFINNLPDLFQEWVAAAFILILIVVQNTIIIYVYIAAEHELDIVLEIDNITHICKEAVRPTGFIETADIWGNGVLACPEEKKFGIAIEKFNRIVSGETAFGGQPGHIIIEEPVIPGC
jgi:hypothetical protein